MLAVRQRPNRGVAHAWARGILAGGAGPTVRRSACCDEDERKSSWGLLCPAPCRMSPCSCSGSSCSCCSSSSNAPILAHARRHQPATLLVRKSLTARTLEPPVRHWRDWQHSFLTSLAGDKVTRPAHGARMRLWAAAPIGCPPDTQRYQQTMKRCWCLQTQGQLLRRGKHGSDRTVRLFCFLPQRQDVSERTRCTAAKTLPRKVKHVRLQPTLLPHL